MEAGAGDGPGATKELEEGADEEEEEDEAAVAAAALTSTSASSASSPRQGYTRVPFPAQNIKRVLELKEKLI